VFGRGKRELVAQTLGRCGILRLLEHVQVTDSLLVLNYHRVTNPAGCEYDRGVISATPDQFYEQMAYFRSRFPVMSLAELVDQLETGKRAHRFRLMVTFDDGYIDNYENAFPVLRSLGLSAVFFLPTSYVDSRIMPWWDQIANLLRRSRNSAIRISYPEAREFSLEEQNLEQTIRQVLLLFKSPAVRDTGRFFAMLEAACGAERMERADPPMFLNWNQVREMAAGGMSIGSHTHKHEILSKLSLAEQTEELAYSRDMLERELGRPTESLAIPVGQRDSFNDDTARALAAARYRVAFSFYGGVNRLQDLRRFDIKRSGVESNMSLARVRMNAALAATTGRNW
jgi:peptidoglycan/xylan/chitin deacetylase (PgdA/CDA1 family)